MTTVLYEIEQRVTTLYQVAEKRFARTFNKPYIRLDLTGKTAGQAWPTKNLLRFNQTLLLENRSHFLKHTVAHEVAHLLAYELFGHTIKAHGKQWQAIMTDLFKLPADRCHSYDTTAARRTRVWRYRCGCHNKVLELSTIRHNRIQKGAVYQCLQCRTPLHYMQA